MSKITTTEGVIVVEIFDKREKADIMNPFASIVASANLGIVKYSRACNDLDVGQKIYFGGQYERLIIEGVDVLAMKESNVIAIVEE